jgi:hypothetical protein
VRVDQLAQDVDTSTVRLRVGGWPVVDGDGLTASLVPLTAPGAPVTREHRTDASPLGHASAADVADLPVEPGRWHAVLVTLAGPARDTYPSAPRRTVQAPEITSAGRTAHVHWPDGERTLTDLP